jgi:mannose-1-phosphate guanylyltransferase
MQIIIVAGGGGTRLWPLSNTKTPKQFVPIIDDESLLRKTYKRLLRDFKKEQIWVNTNKKYFNKAKNCLPEDFPEGNLILEPEKRDNYAAVISAAAVVSNKSGENEPLIFIPCDDLLVDEQSINNFNKSLEKIAVSLRKAEFDIITAGVKPTYGCTNYGYIQIEEKDIQSCFEKPVPVINFKEKPDEETAEKFYKSGNYLWNKFNHSFTFGKLKEKLRKLDPETLKIVEEFEKEGKISKKRYAKIPKIAFDYAVLERAESLGVVGMDISWEDLGNWEVVEKYLPNIGDQVNHIEVGGKNNKIRSIYSSKKIAFVGLSDMLLIESEEGLLVIDPKNSKEIKKVSEYFDGERK